MGILGHTTIMKMYIESWGLCDCDKYMGKNKVICIKRQCKQIWKMIVSMFSLIGLLVAIDEAFRIFFNYEGFFLIYKKYPIQILLVLAIIAIWKNWDRLCYKVKISGSSDVSITLKMCNIFKNAGAVIIPTNSTFDTLMDDDFISEGSVQGQYQLKYFKNRFTELDRLIKQGLIEQDYITINDGRTTNKKRYPIGTLSKVSEGRKRAYFLVNSNINKHGIPENVDISDIASALVKLWDELNVIGNKEDYSIPLLGTGKVGVKNASRDDVIKLIVTSFLAATREHKITENLNICIHPSDFEKIHWDDLCEYIKYQCSFAYVGKTSEIVGRSEEAPMEVAFSNGDDNYEFSELDKELYDSDYYSEKIIELLKGNQLKISDIAIISGRSMNATRVAVKELIDKGLIQEIGDGMDKKYTVK